MPDTTPNVTDEAAKAARDLALVEGTREVKPAARRVRCGGGIDQPAWPKCIAWAQWKIPGQTYAYCTEHAALKVRALRFLATP